MFDKVVTIIAFKQQDQPMKGWRNLTHKDKRNYFFHYFLVAFLAFRTVYNLFFFFALNSFLSTFLTVKIKSLFPIRTIIHLIIRIFSLLIIIYIFQILHSLLAMILHITLTNLVDF